MFGDERAEIGVRFVDGRAIFVLTKQGSPWKRAAASMATAIEGRGHRAATMFVAWREELGT